MPRRKGLPGGISLACGGSAVGPGALGGRALVGGARVGATLVWPGSGTPRRTPGRPRTPCPPDAPAPAGTAGSPRSPESPSRPDRAASPAGPESPGRPAGAGWPEGPGSSGSPGTAGLPGILVLLESLLLRLVLVVLLPLPPLAGGLVRVGVHAARPVVRAMMTIPPQYLPTIITSTFAVSLATGDDIK